MDKENALILLWMSGSIVTTVMLLTRRPHSETLEKFENIFPAITLMLSWYIVLELIVAAYEERHASPKNDV